MWRLVAIGMFGSCGFSAGGGNSPIDAAGTTADAPGTVADAPGTMADAPPDAAPIDAPPAVAVVCVGTFKTVCISQPIGTTTLDVNNPLLINTDTSSMCQSPAAGSQITSACILAYASFQLNDPIRATGSRPLILIASGAISINGGASIDVASRGTERGAGARTCTGFSAPGSRAGGAGASHGTLGGLGGNGGGSTSGSVPAVQPITTLAGGCPGIPGGSTAVIERGPGGLGGGATLLIANAITVNGDINASGGGGGGGVTAMAGGGGGGAGGMVVLDAPTLTINGGGRVFAQGGGGGEGAGLLTSGDTGKSVTSAGAAALGGTGNQSVGGDGGLGAVSATGAAGGAGSSSGGGGGGGAGHIRTTANNLTNTGQTFPTMTTP